MRIGEFYKIERAQPAHNWEEAIDFVGALKRHNHGFPVESERIIAMMVGGMKLTDGKYFGYPLTDERLDDALRNARRTEHFTKVYSFFAGHAVAFETILAPPFGKPSLTIFFESKYDHAEYVLKVLSD